MTYNLVAKFMLWLTVLNTQLKAAVAKSPPREDSVRDVRCVAV